MGTHMRMGCRAALLFLLGTAFAQGPLTPPGGPAPTMKTLDQIEPRVLISSLPYTITQPGSYALDRNLHADANGLRIEASDVVVDFMGHTLSGATNSTLTVGVDVPVAGFRNISIGNGRIVGFGTGLRFRQTNGGRLSHLDLSHALESGLHLIGGEGLRMEYLNVSACGGNGVFFDEGLVAGGGHVLRHGVIQANGSHGIRIFSGVTQGGGHTIEDCRIAGNANGGMDILATGASGRIQDLRIARCVLQDNQGHGIRMQGAGGGITRGNVIESSSLRGNSGHGLWLYLRAHDHVLSDLAVSGNGAEGIRLEGGTDGNRILRPRVEGNTGLGILVLSSVEGPARGNWISEGIVRDNGDHGISLQALVSGRIAHNRVSDTFLGGHAVSGLHLYAEVDGQVRGNRLERNTASGNGEGLRLHAAGDSVVAGNRIQEGWIGGNDLAGIDLLGTGRHGNNLIADLVVAGNGTHGIRIQPPFGAVGSSWMRVRGNTVFGHAGPGIRVEGIPARFNLLAHNLVDQASGFSIGPLNAYGPIVPTVGPLPTSGAARHPWANFSPNDL